MTGRLRQLEEENGRVKKIVPQQGAGSRRSENGAVKKVGGSQAEREAVRVVR